MGQREESVLWNEPSLGANPGSSLIYNFSLKLKQCFVSSRPRGPWSLGYILGGLQFKLDFFFKFWVFIFMITKNINLSILDNRDSLLTEYLRFREKRLLHFWVHKKVEILRYPCPQTLYGSGWNYVYLQLCDQPGSVFCGIAHTSSLAVSTVVNGSDFFVKQHLICSQPYRLALRYNGLVV